jgi:Protein of unknown function (DUF3089)
VKKQFLFLILILTIAACSKPVPVVIATRPDLAQLPPKPDYANPDHWAALPTKKDQADELPKKSNLTENQANALADVFFIHPTIYTYAPEAGKYPWNGDVNDGVLNQKTDNSTILNQATPFNGSCKIYAPRYRQAHFYVFRTPNKEDRISVLDIAYEDVKAAFEYYLQYHHKGRPLVIASHSQGTLHARRLLKEFFDDKPLQKYLVCAYIIGGPVQPNEFKTIKPAASPNQLGGFVSWNTFAKDFLPAYYNIEYNTASCVNPLTWTLDQNYAPKELNKGAVGYGFKMFNQAVDAQVHGGILWITKPYMPGRMFINTKVWHAADINFFWQSIRDNVDLRIKTYLNK